jgi:hypothetical protein
MAFVLAQTSADYIDLLNDVIAEAIKEEVGVVAVAAGGTGYAVNDVLTVVGGTGTAATINVDSVTGGVVDGVSIITPGRYTVFPTSPVSTTVAPAGGSGCTLTLTSVGWTIEMETQEAVSAVIAAGGTGYAINDALTLVGGTLSELTGSAAAVFDVASEGAVSATLGAGGSGYTNGAQVLTVSGGTFTTAAQFNVTVSAGTVTSVDSLATAGDYTVTPGNPAATTGGGGTGATLNVTYGAVATVALSSKGKYDFVPSNAVATTVAPSGGTGCTLTVTWQGFLGGEKQVILKGNGTTGTDSIYIGMSATDQTGGKFQWDIRGFTGFQTNVNWSQQPGISPAGSYVPLNNSQIRYWLFISPRRIVGVFRMGATYTNMYLGFLNPFATTVQYPYPMMVMGCSSIPQLFSTSTVAMSGMLNPINVSTGNRVGPGFIRTPGGSWRGVANSSGTSNRQQNTEVVVWPAGSPTTTGNFRMIDFVPQTGNPGSATSVMKQTQDSTVTSNWVFPLISTIVMENDQDIQFLGELDGIYWAGTQTETIGQAISEDQYDENGQTYHLFQNCNNTDPWAYFLIKEV